MSSDDRKTEVTKEDIIAAAKAGNLDVIKALYQADEEEFSGLVNEYENDDQSAPGLTALHHALINGHAAVAMQVFNYGADPYAFMHHGATYATWNDAWGDEDTDKFNQHGLDAIQYAIRHNQTTDHHLLPFLLHLMRCEGNDSYVNRAAPEGTKYAGHTPFSFAVYNRQLQIVLHMLGRGNLETRIGRHHQTLLHIALERTPDDVSDRNYQSCVMICEHIARQCAIRSPELLQATLADDTTTPLVLAQAKGQVLIDLFTNPQAYFQKPTPAPAVSPPSVWRGGFFGGAILGAGVPTLTFIGTKAIPQVATFITGAAAKIGGAGWLAAVGVGGFFVLGGVFGAAVQGIRLRRLQPIDGTAAIKRAEAGSPAAAPLLVNDSGHGAGAGHQLGSYANFDGALRGQGYEGGLPPTPSRPSAPSTPSHHHQQSAGGAAMPAMDFLQQADEVSPEQGVYLSN